MSTPADVIREFYGIADDQTKSTDDIARYFAESYVDHNRSPEIPADLPDHIGTIGFFDALRAAFPDAVHRLDIVGNIGDDRAVVYWTYAGTHTGQFYDFAPSGAEFSINGVDIFRVENGQFVEHWHVEELAKFFDQLGG